MAPSKLAGYNDGFRSRPHRRDWTNAAAAMEGLDHRSLQQTDMPPVPPMHSGYMQTPHMMVPPYGFPPVHPYYPMMPPMPMPMPMPQQHAGTYNHYDVSASSYDNDVENYDDENFSEDGTGGQRMSASAARRRRRQRATAKHTQQPWPEPSRAGADTNQSSSRCSMNLGHLRAELEKGGEGLPAVLAEIKKNVRQLAFHPEGCWVLQTAFEKADEKSRIGLCAGLEGCVRRAVSSPYGNYVVQKVIQVMEVQWSRFIVMELLTVGAHVSGHRFGCRIMCRLLEKSSSDQRTVELVEEILNETGKLCRHNYAHYVIESILENGLDLQKSRIIQALQAEPFSLAADRHGSYVIESALKNHPTERDSLIATFLENKSELIKLADNHSGFCVLKALLKYSEQGSELRNLLNDEKEELQRVSFGNKVLEELKDNPQPAT